MTELDLGELGKRETLGRGNYATVFRVPELSLPGITGSLAFKSYFSRVTENRGSAIRASIRALMRVREDGPEDVRKLLDARSTWPLAVVRNEDGGAAGFVMREIPRDYFATVHFSTGREKIKPLEAVLYLQSTAEVADRQLPQLTDEHRLYLILRVLGFVRVVHALGVVIGDFSSNNIIFAITPNRPPETARPMFVDTDSYRLRTGVPAIRQPQTPDWYTPEYKANHSHYLELVARNAPTQEVASALSVESVQDQRSDVYKASLFAMRLFHEDQNPHSVFVSPKAIARLRALRGNVAADAIEQGLSPRSENRPTMDELARRFAGT